MQYRGILREHASVLHWLLHAVDWLIVSLMGWVVYRLYLASSFFETPFSEVPLLETDYYLVIGLTVLLSAWLFPRFQIYQVWRGGSLFEEIRALTLAWATVLLFLLFIAFAAKVGAEFSRVWLGLWALSTWVMLVLSRVVLRVFSRSLRERGFNLKRIVVVGATELGGELIERVGNSPWMGMEVVGVFSNGDSYSDSARVSDGKTPIIGAIRDVGKYVAQNEIDQVWITLALKDEDVIKVLLHDLRHSAVDIRFVPNIFEFRLLNHSMTEVAGLPVINLSMSPMDGVNSAIKELEDRVLSFLILIISSPVFLTLAIGIKLTSPGPIFYRQERIGWSGKPFKMLKFRSMPVDTEGATGPVWAKPGEERATKFGGFLRSTSLDELPQFINVLKGDMSIVGPRPERPIFVDKFKDEVPGYMQKHLVKAGITGWAQVNGWRGDTDLGKRIEYDLFYIENWSLWFDLRIMFLTLFKGFSNRNAY